MKHFVLVVLAALLMGGCYFTSPVSNSEVGLVLADGVSISRVVGPGRHGPSLKYWADFRQIDVSAKTLEWTDPDLVTQDKQPIGLALVVTYGRKPDESSIRAMWGTYKLEAVNDEALARQVMGRIPRAAKAVTTQYSLDQMLGVAVGDESGREVITSRLFSALEKELAEVYITLYDVGISNISPSSDYLVLLERKANASVEAELRKEEAKRDEIAAQASVGVAEKQTLLLAEKLKQEKAQTDIEVEKARRENLINEELAKVYALNPQYYELERLKLLGGVLGDNDKVYFVPQGTDLSLILGGTQGQIVPVER